MPVLSLRCRRLNRGAWRNRLVHLVRAGAGRLYRRTQLRGPPREHARSIAILAIGFAGDAGGSGGAYGCQRLPRRGAAAFGRARFVEPALPAAHIVVGRTQYWAHSFG